MSSINTSKASGLRARRKRSIRAVASPKARRGSASQSRAPAVHFTVSKELIADRLGCMLKQIRKGCAKQVLLHTALISSSLHVSYPNAQTVRDFVHEGLGWFMRGNRLRAAQRIEDAMDAWSAGQREADSTGLSRLRSHAARA